MATLITDCEEARKLAVSIIGDVAFYNREKIRLALKNDTLFEMLKPELDEARDMYSGRVDEELEQKYNLFNRAVVDIIIKSFANEETTIW
jgi:hypothetical protein